jgi:hypothetical protein
MGVIAHHGSLTAYRAFIIAGRDACSTRLARSNVEAMTDRDRARVADTRQELADWKADLAWVDAAIEEEAIRHGAETLGINDLRRRYENHQG